MNFNITGVNMLEKIKKRLIHFRTDGNIIEDFVAARLRKAGFLRRVIHYCFYVQCVAAAACCVAGIFFTGSVAAALIICAAAAVSIAAAFMALGGGFTAKTVSYTLDLLYAVICFFQGERVFYVCGGIMLAAAAAALASFAAGYFRKFLLEYSPLKITREDYDFTVYYRLRQLEEPPAPPPPPPPPPRSEMRLLADRVVEILGNERP